MVTKSWKKVGDTYYLFLNQEVVGSLHIHDYSHQVCEIKIKDKKYILTKTGRWLTGFKITDESENEIGFANAEKWYANNLGLSLNNETYKIEVRNNPLVEWYIIDSSGFEIASCGMKATNSKIEVELNAKNTNLMLEFILWYLFLPIALENFASDIPFTQP